jgi:hypothetical protein
MSLNKFTWNCIRKAAHAVLIDVDQETFSLPVTNIKPTDAQGLDLYLSGIRFEIELGETLEFAFKALKEGTEAFESAHNLAANVVVKEPSQAKIADVERDLRIIHAAKQNDDRFAAAMALAVAVADIAAQFNQS